MTLQTQSDTEMPLHPFRSPVGHIALPERFTNPFDYQPHPLCVLAAEEVQAYLAARREWADELRQGKMFGVLAVRTDADGALGYLAAFSGLLAGRSVQPFFVPPVYDLQRPGGFFKPEEEAISALNRRIAALEADEGYRTARQRLAEAEDALHQWQSTARRRLQDAKALRAARRQAAPLAPAEEEALVRQSQREHAEYKREMRIRTAQIDRLRTDVAALEQPIEALREERRRRSADLQRRLFDQFRLLNARGEERTLTDIFEAYTGHLPPGGAGECAAPKLLQCAYRHGWRPLAMAEFWWGASPAGEHREHGRYYPACQSKCAPILRHMLQGLEVI